MKRVLLLLLALCALLALPAGALADGDPGSDELVYNHLFIGAGDNVSVAQQARLENLLVATVALRAPIRVAIIGQRADLGTVTSLWGKPASYGYYLGIELDQAYDGRLIVVMPQGVALYWYHHGLDTLPTIHSGATPGQLVAAATQAIRQVSAGAGISAARLDTMAAAPNLESRAMAASRTQLAGAVASVSSADAGAEPTASSRARDVSPAVVLIGLLLLLSAMFWAPPLWRRRGLLRRGGIALPGLALGCAALATLVLLAVLEHSRGNESANVALATNPDLSVGTPLKPQPAYPIRLTDETGQTVSLSQYRGKVVILSFTDDECQTICPLTTQAMVDARDSLGAAKDEVQLLGINANWDSTQVEDVQNYSQVHGLLGQWHFLTGSDAQLRPVWNAYGVGKDINFRSNQIDHDPATYIIDPQGRVREVYTTYASYGAISQFGQVLAQEASRLLPSHPAVSTHLSYDTVRGIGPAQAVSLPLADGGSLKIGTGGPRLFLFFDTWDKELTPLRGEMEALNRYALAARRLGLPPLVAVDEASVEPNRAALTGFLSGTHLDYPVAIDTTGQLADGYGVTGEPWFVLTHPSAHDTVANPAAQLPWYDEVSDGAWPSLSALAGYVRAAMRPAPPVPRAAQVARDLAGSPPALAAVHAEAGRILGGGPDALLARVRALRGHPIVLNVWGSWCTPCQREFSDFATVSAIDGKRVAFLGADYDEASLTDAEEFLAGHPVSYPSYGISDGDFPNSLLSGGVSATPTTIFISATGKVTDINVDQYQSEQALAQDVATYALGQ